MIATASAATQPFGETLAGDASWWIVLDVAVILVITALLILRDLSASNRPFEWARIIFSVPFFWLLIVQAFIVCIALVVLVGFGRATLRYGVDALWISLAGLSLLKSLPAGQGQDAQRLWSLADWLFKKFYRDLSLEIVRQSDLFRDYLLHTYANNPGDFLRHSILLISATELASDSATDQQTVTANFNAQPNEAAQVEFLANWIVPRTTQKEWRRVTGN